MADPSWHLGPPSWYLEDPPPRVEVRTRPRVAMRSRAGGEMPTLYGQFASFEEWAEIDSVSEGMLYLPEPEAPTRLAKQLAQLHAALLTIGVGAEEAWRVTRKVGWDSVPAVRCAVVNCLAGQSEPVTHALIEEKTGLPDKTVRRAVEDLVALRLARRTKDAGKWYVEESPITHEYWVSERLPETSEGVQHLVETKLTPSVNGHVDLPPDAPEWERTWWERQRAPE